MDITEKKSNLGVSPLVSEKFHIDIVDVPNGVGLQFGGEIDLKDPTVLLDPFFTAIHAFLIAKRIKYVEADFRKLTFLNSSGIKSIIKWVMNIGKLSEEHQYSLKIIYSKHVTWQGVSLITISCLLPSLVTVEKSE